MVDISWTDPYIFWRYPKLVNSENNEGSFWIYRSLVKFFVNKIYFIPRIKYNKVWTNTKRENKYDEIWKFLESWHGRRLWRHIQFFVFLKQPELSCYWTLQDNENFTYISHVKLFLSLKLYQISIILLSFTLYDQDEFHTYQINLTNT